MKAKIKIQSVLLTLLLITFSGFCQVPSGYYNNASGKTGNALRTALQTIISNGHVKLPYTSSSFDVWDAYEYTDVTTTGGTTIWDMYSLCNFTLFTDQCTGGTSSECVGYAREHSMPNSWWGGLDDSNNPQYTDLHHLFPADQYVNQKKSDHPIGQVSSPTWTSINGSKLGPCSWPGYTGTVFEPIDEYKGDIARAYFYIATRYMNKLSGWVTAYPSSEAGNVINSTGNNFKQWFIDMLVSWCIEDPVSQKEINRNNNIYYHTPQKNRNPYIDHPEYVCMIWASSYCSVVSIPKSNTISKNHLFKLYPNPATDKVSCYIISSEKTELNFEIDNYLGQNIYRGKLDVQNGDNNFEFDISKFQQGLYYFIIRDENYIIEDSIKLVIQ
jgi:endonuclease I